MREKVSGTYSRHGEWSAVEQLHRARRARVYPRGSLFEDAVISAGSALWLPLISPG